MFGPGYSKLSWQQTNKKNQTNRKTNRTKTIRPIIWFGGIKRTRTVKLRLVSFWTLLIYKVNRCYISWKFIKLNKITVSGDFYFSYPNLIMCLSSAEIYYSIINKRKRKRYDSVLWQKPLHQQKCQKGKVTTQTTPQKSSIKQRLRTDLGRSVGVTTATQLVWLTGLTGPPSH